MTAAHITILLVFPFPTQDAGIEARTVAVDLAHLDPSTTVECRGTKTAIELGGPHPGISAYETLLMEIYLVEAVLDSDLEHCHAIVIDSTSDSGLDVLRSRLDIPVVGPGQTAFHVAATLGRRISVLMYERPHTALYEKTLRAYGLRDRVVSLRAAGTCGGPVPDGSPQAVEQLIAAAKAAIEVDGADVLVLGSTTMVLAAEAVAAAVDVPVINPGPLALKHAEALVRLRLRHSRRAYPEPGVVQDERFNAAVRV